MEAVMVIYKYKLDPSKGPTQNIEMPKGAEILSVALQYGRPTMWALVPHGPDVEMEKRTIHLVFTGYQVGEEFSGRRYIGTVLMNGDTIVVHFFE